jgi:predicted nucleic acid-binding protein
LILVDTDVFIWLLRGREEAREALLSSDGTHLSVVTRMELVQGMRSRQELPLLNRTLVALGAKTVDIDAAISSRASLLVESHFHSHHLLLADALIAATALQHGLPLLTGNHKHYKNIPGLDLQKFKIKEP